MKLLDLLVQELPKRGGWPEGANYVVQEYDGTVKFSKSINFLHIKAGEWCSNEDGDDWIYGDRPFEGNFRHYITANDWNISIVTREKYEAALAASKELRPYQVLTEHYTSHASAGKTASADDADGWIEWAGGECPVDGDAIIEVKYRNPSPLNFNHDRAGDFSWLHHGFDSDIIAYRLQQPTKSEQVRDDAAEDNDEADLNERIGQDVDTPEWNGEGLPPVGIKCEHCPGGTTQHEWEIVTVAGVHENTSTGFTDYWLVRENGSSYIVGNPYRFRPLRTEAEKSRDRFVKLVMGWMHHAGAAEIALIYDAISAGKIPGVKLEENNGY